MVPSQILVINCGSSSLKFALYQVIEITQSRQSHSSNTEKSILAEGLAESLNQAFGTLRYKTTKTNKNNTVEDREKIIEQFAIESNNAHATALERILTILEEQYDLSTNLAGVGHRVVHGGSLFSSSVRINESVLNQIKSCVPLAPLHNPANITGIEILLSHFGDIPQVAVFDTSFHQTLPQSAFCYGLPYSLYKEHGVRKYGFHGTSHRYIAQQASNFLNKPLEETNIVCAHLGNGASVAAISHGKSVDTSMGMTPLEGLIMGTRSGDIDPGIFDYLVSLGYSANDISEILNKKSGLLGVSGESNDMRTICENAQNGNKQSKLALDMFCFRAAKHIAGMMASLSSIDALVFTGGIGENASMVRALIVKRLAIFNFEINLELNDAPSYSVIAGKPFAEINKPKSNKVLIIPTDEEGSIVEDTLSLIYD